MIDSKSVNLHNKDQEVVVDTVEFVSKTPDKNTTLLAEIFGANR